MPNPWIEDPPGFIPVFRIVAVYAIPFAFGWLLFLQSDLLETITRRAWLVRRAARWWRASPIATATICRSTARSRFYADPRRACGGGVAADPGRRRPVPALSRPATARYRRYLCDSSYFLYIAHMPMILAFQLLLKDVPLPPLAKIAIALVGTIAVLMPVYRYGVRPTFIGAVLNGRQYPGALTATVAAAARASRTSGRTRPWAAAGRACSCRAGRWDCAGSCPRRPA